MSASETGTAQAGLDVIIVGAGLGGLAAAIGLRRAGHQVRLFEQAPALAEVGAGIQMAPNASRVLLELGLGEKLAPLAVRAERTVRRRWQDGTVLGSSPLGAAVQEHYGAPYWHIHRADLHSVLLDAAVAAEGVGAPVQIILNSIVDTVEDTAGMPAAVVLKDGSRHEADLVIGADGIHSAVRRELGLLDNPQFSGDIAWRATIPAERAAEHPELAWIVEEPAVTIWLGPRRHLVHYLVRGGTLINIVAIASAEESQQESWMQAGDPADLVADFSDWDPQVQRLLSLVDSVTCSALFDRKPLTHWVDGRVALLGDSCHAMLPYQAQGAGQAFEDAAALTSALSGVTVEAVPAALLAYQEERMTRANTVQAASRANQDSFHLPDGPEQQARDAAFANLVGDSMVSFDWLWGYGRELGGATPAIR